MELPLALSLARAPMAPLEGASRGEGGTSRAEITARYNFGNSERRGSLSDVQLSFGESTNYERSDTVAVSTSADEIDHSPRTGSTTPAPVASSTR